MIRGLAVGGRAPIRIASVLAYKGTYRRVPFLAFFLTFMRALIAFCLCNYSTFCLCGFSCNSQPRGMGERSEATHYDPLAIPLPAHLALYTKTNTYLCALLTNIKKAIDICIFMLYNNKRRQQEGYAENISISVECKCSKWQGAS